MQTKDLNLGSLARAAGLPFAKVFKAWRGGILKPDFLNGHNAPRWRETSVANVSKLLGGKTTVAASTVPTPGNTAIAAIKASVNAAFAKPTVPAAQIKAAAPALPQTPEAAWLAMSPAEQGEFGTKAIYLAYARGASRGAIKIYGS
jgi:hypothetical protein